jgi:hypothetical protein
MLEDHSSMPEERLSGLCVLSRNKVSTINAVTFLPERVIVGFQNGVVSHKQNKIWGRFFRFFFGEKK